MSDDDIRAAVASAAPPEATDREPWPIVCLGHRSGRYYFITVAGEIAALGARDFGHTALLMLFGGDPRWLVNHFAPRDESGSPTGDFIVKHATAALIRRCTAVGLWDPETSIRGIGVWPTGRHVLAHCGDTLFVFDRGKMRRMPAGLRLDDALYPAAPPVSPPGDNALEAHQVEQLVGCLRRWSYARDESPLLLLGWIGLALLGAAAPWRVHIYVSGDRGAGKSKLAALVRGYLGPQGRSFNDYTEAGLRQLITGEARAVILDEAEEDNDNDRNKGTIVLLRRMSGGSGAQAVRGGSDGTSKQYVAAASVWLAGINPPSFLPQDRSRIYECELKPHEDRNAEAVDRAIDDAPALSAGLRTRALKGWPRFVDNCHVYRQALVEAGCDGRQADKFGTLLAAAEMLRSDVAIDSDSAREQVEKMKPLLDGHIAEDREDSDAAQCLTTLLTKQIEHWQGGSRSTLGRLIIAARSDHGADARKALGLYGLKIETLQEDGARRQVLYVAHRHEALRDVFRGTRWRDGGWKAALRRLPGATSSPRPIRISGSQSRCVVIGEEHLPAPGDDTAPASIGDSPDEGD